LAKVSLRIKIFLGIRVELISNDLRKLPQKRAIRKNECFPTRRNAARISVFLSILGIDFT
jgi:hypothetical protein